MTTKLYSVTVPMRLSVEANSKAEAISILRNLWREASLTLPVGAGAFMKDHLATEHLQACTVQD